MKVEIEKNSGNSEIDCSSNISTLLFFIYLEWLFVSGRRPFPQHAFQPGFFPEEHVDQRQHPPHQLPVRSHEGGVVSVDLRFPG